MKRRWPLLLAVTVLLWVDAGIHAADALPLENLRRMSGVRGGLCLYLGCRDRGLLAALSGDGKYLVHGLATEKGAADALRRFLDEKGLAAQASIEHLAGAELPYEKNHVNLIVADDLAALRKAGVTLAEIVRVLAPYGMACLGIPSGQEEKFKKELAACGIARVKIEKKSRPWLVFMKPQLPGMADWGRYGGSSGVGCLVSSDTYLAGPNQIQWHTGPILDTGHANQGPLKKPGAPMLASRGIVYFYSREGKRRGIMARDAYSGVKLWSMPWKGILYASRQIAWRDELIMITNPKFELLAVSGRTGKKIRSFGKVKNYTSLYLFNDVLLVFGGGRLNAIDLKTSKPLWSTRIAANFRDLIPDRWPDVYVVMGNGRVYFQTQKSELVCMDLKSGKVLFRKNPGLGRPYMLECIARGRVIVRTQQSPAPVKKEYTDMQGNGKNKARKFVNSETSVVALSGKDGSVVWKKRFENPAHAFRGRILYAAGKVWLARWKTPLLPVYYVNAGTEPAPALWEGLDPATGKVLESFTGFLGKPHGCTRQISTARYLVPTQTPHYFISYKTKKAHRVQIWRLSCQVVGPILSQGLAIAVNNKWGCGCGKTQLYGSLALSSDGDAAREGSASGAVPAPAFPLEKGPAAPPPAASETAPEDWPMYRHDMQRTASTTVRVSPALKIAWQSAPLFRVSARPSMLDEDRATARPSNDPLTAPSVALGKVFVGVKQARKVVALDQKTGRLLWTRYLGAPVDAPPTIYKGLCLVGCHDGWVYALRADNGKLVWRRRAAPAERRIFAFGDLESTWPVVGGVLVAGDRAFALAGRHTDIDGGLYVSAFDPLSGEPRWPKVGRHYLDNPGNISWIKPVGASYRAGYYDPKLYKSRNYQGSADLLLSDGRKVAIGAQKGKGVFDCRTGKTGGVARVARVGWIPNAAIIAGSSARPYYPSTWRFGKATRVYTGFQSPRRKSIAQSIGWKRGWKLPTTPRMPQALCLAGDLLIAGISENLPKNSKGEIWLINTADGKKKATIPLPSAPVFDGIAAAGKEGSVYVVMRNGTVARLARAPSGSSQ